MHTQKTIRLIIISVAVILIAGCQREKKVTGCTDPRSDHYNKEANDSCCCDYSASYMVWFPQESLNFYHYERGYQEVTVWIDKVEVTQKRKLNFYNDPPDDCKTYLGLAEGFFYLGTQREKECKVAILFSGSKNYNNVVLDFNWVLKAGQCNLYRFY